MDKVITHEIETTTDLNVMDSIENALERPLKFKELLFIVNQVDFYYE
jgi:hypothetical protein